MKTAIVLSGGGAKGAYQVGFYKAIKKLKIKYDIVTGTSVGALNGVFFVEQSYRKIYNIWKNISYKDIYGMDITMDIEKIDLFKKHAKAFILEGGMNTKALEDMFVEKIDLNKIKKSKIDFGITTYNLTDLKPVYKTKNELLKNHFTDFVLASASIFPAFKTKKIGNKEYIDGGYFDQVPIDLAIKMGAENIIVVDVKGIGFKKEVSLEDKKLITIKPRQNIGNVLEFNKDIANLLMKYGYNDTMKQFKKLDGRLYTFKKDDLNKNYNRYSELMRNTIVEIFNKSKNSTNKLVEILSGKKFNRIFNNAIEVLAKDFQMPDYKIYNINILNYKIKQKFDLKNNYDIVDPLFKYQKIYNELENKNYSKLRKMSILYNKEFLAGIYLYVIIKKGFII